MSDAIGATGDGTSKAGQLKLLNLKKWPQNPPDAVGGLGSLAAVTTQNMTHAVKTR